MKAFLKTLFGDAATIAVVLVVIAAEWLLCANGLVAAAVLYVPLLVLAGAGWLATR
jgi:hypothetical protein